MSLIKLSMMREFRKEDLVWLRPIAEKYGSWNDLEKIAKDPEGYHVATALVIAPFAVGTIFYDDHGAVLEGLCDRYGIKQFMRLGHFLCRVADDYGLDLHNHKGQKDWERKALKRLGFTDSGTKIGYTRFAENRPEAEAKEEST